MVNSSQQLSINGMRQKTVTFIQGVQVLAPVKINLGPDRHGYLLGSERLDRLKHAGPNHRHRNRSHEQ